MPTPLRGCDSGLTCGGVYYQWTAADANGCITPPNGTPGEHWRCCAPGQCEAGGEATTNPCCNNVTQCLDAHNARHCVDDSTTIYIRIYHDPTLLAAMKCDDTEYALEVSNGK